MAGWSKKLATLAMVAAASLSSQADDHIDCADLPLLVAMVGANG